MHLNRNGRDWGVLVNWDDLGKAYTGFIIFWTITLCTGIVWLVQHRQLPFIKIRNLPLTILSTTFLHLYLVKICLAYTTNGHFTCSAEFWIMSIYLPLGIALFQANMVQLRSVSDQQQNLIKADPTPSSRKERSFIKRVYQFKHQWSLLSMAQKTYVFIGIGLVIQLVVTGVLYAVTPTLQGDWKSYGKVTHAKGQALCRKSPEWTPSALWQLIWSWLFGPYILFKIRKIHDVHHWRLQVMLSVISGLPGTPLWLAALHDSKFKPVNKWWVPPMWLAPGIIVMQFVTVFFPIFEAYRSRSQMRTTLSIIESWDDRRQLARSETSTDPRSLSEASWQKSETTLPSAPTRRNKEIRCMVSLEKALSVNPFPLLHFAATKDFTAENVIFLMKVRSWRAAWASAPRDNDSISDDARTRLFNVAVHIYATWVHDRTAEFPINIESNIKSALDAMFKPALSEDQYLHDSSYSHTDIFDLPKPRASKTYERIILTRGASNDSEDTIWDRDPCSPTSTDSDATKFSFEPHPCVDPLKRTGTIVQPGFDEHVFDAAEKSIKYLVLTNTWQKFVDTISDKLQDTIAP